MNFLKSIANDMLNGFSVEDIPVFIARIFFAALVALVFKHIYSKKYSDESSALIRYLIPLSVAICVVVPIAQFSISLGLILSAIMVVVLVNIKSSNSGELLYVLFSLLFSASIGAGYVVYSLVGLIPVVVLLLFAKK